MERAKNDLIYFKNIISFFQNTLEDQELIDIFEPLFKTIPEDVQNDWKTIINTPQIFYKQDITLTTENLATFIDKKLEQLHFLVYKKIDEQFFMYSEEYHDKLFYLIALENEDSTLENFDSIDKTKYHDFKDKLLFRVFNDDGILTPVYCSNQDRFQNKFNELFTFEKSAEHDGFYKDTKNDKYWILLTHNEVFQKENDQEELNINDMMKNLSGMPGLSGAPFDLSKLMPNNRTQNNLGDSDGDGDGDVDSDGDIDDEDGDGENPKMQNPLNCMQQ
jgi:hypothetical protein